MGQLASQRNAPGTLREYETIFIMKSDAASDDIQEINNRVRKVIEDSGGKVMLVDNWGKRKLAYEISKQLKGIYLYWQYLGEAELVSELERNLRLLDIVIRYYTVRIDEDVDPAIRPSQFDEEKFLAAATIAPDEEDNYMGRGTVDEPAADDGEGTAAAAVDGAAPDTKGENSEETVEAKTDDAAESVEAKTDDAAKTPDSAEEKIAGEAPDAAEPTKKEQEE